MTEDEKIQHLNKLLETEAKTLNHKKKKKLRERYDALLETTELYKEFNEEK